MNPGVNNIIVSMRNERFTIQHIADTPSTRLGTVSGVIIFRFKKRSSTKKNKPRSRRRRIPDSSSTKGQCYDLGVHNLTERRNMSLETEE